MGPQQYIATRISMEHNGTAALRKVYTPENDQDTTIGNFQ
jgi:hypothetical protein